MKYRFRVVFAVIVVLFMSRSLLAHPGHISGNGIDAGLSHPFSGADHILAMVAVGLWAAQVGGRSLWMLPATFVALMIGGGVLAKMNVPLPMVEQGMLASVLVLGLMIATAVKVPIQGQVALVGLFAVFHGYAHFAATNSMQPMGLYAAGFVLATAALHGCGVGLGQLAKNVPSWKLLPSAGGAVAACGVGMLFHIL